MANASQFGLIRIKRESRYPGCLSPLIVLIDGREVGRVANGKEVTFRVQAGTRFVQLKILLTPGNSAIIEVKPNETVHLVCGVRSSGIYLGEVSSNTSQTLQIPEADQHATSQTSFQIVREERAKEYFEVIDIEEFPLDNTSGNDTLSVEFEVSKTSSVEVSIEKSREYSGNLEIGLLSFLKTQLSTSLLSQVGKTVGQTITRRQTLKFSVQPHQSVVYLVVWKRKVRTGMYVIQVSNKQITVPYKVDYDLSYEIKTRA